MSDRYIKAGNAWVEISAINDPLRKKLAQSQAMLKAFGSGIGSIASSVSVAWLAVAAAVAPAVLAIKQFVDFGSAINDMSGRTGKAAGDLQVLSFAAGQTGASLADVEAALRNMAKKGFDVAEFEDIGEGIAGIKDPTERAAKAIEIFGKSGTKLIPMFDQWQSLKAASLALGPILTDEEVKLADDLGDAFSSLQTALARASQQMVVAFGPELQALLNGVIGRIVRFAELVSEIKAGGGGGDWLDKWAEFMRTTPEDFAKIGAQGSGAFSTSGAALEMEDADDQKEQLKASERAAKAAQDMWNAIQKGNEARGRLVQEFETPAEKFLRKQKEIAAAMGSLNNNRLMGFLGEDEAAMQQHGLKTAMARLQEEERKRLKDLMPDVETIQRETLGLHGGASGTFSAAGAALLGRGGDSLELREAKNQTKLQERIAKAVEDKKVVRFK